MIWVSNKYNLDYYSNKPAELCYCDFLSTASDMLLQGDWEPSGSPYTETVEVWNVDASTALEVIDPSLYDIYFAVNPLSGRHFFTFRLKSYSSVMCDQKCFLIRIGITNSINNFVFANWTERYCIGSCCENVSGISIQQDGYIVSETSTPTGQSGLPSNTCGDKLIRLITSSDCNNVYNGKYYGKPATIISGSYIPYVDISCFGGDLRQRGREITREYSYNCKMQRVEASRTYLLSGHEAFPTWKMDEISSQLSCTNIWIDDFQTVKKIEFFGGSAFSLYSEEICWDVFKLSATMNDCILRQIFGCTVTCDATEQVYYFVIPAAYQSGGLFYDNNGNLIAEAVDGDGFSLINWFIAQGLTAELIIPSPPLNCEYYAIIGVSGNIIPQSIYYNLPILPNQITPLFVSLEDICDYIANSGCSVPVVLSTVCGDIPCDAPIIISTVSGDVTGEPVTISPQSPWVEVTSSGNLYNNNVEWSLDATKAIVGNPGDLYQFSVEYVGNVSANGVPSANRIIDTVTANFPSGVSILIDTFGHIYFTGEMVVPTMNEAEVDFVNLIYQLI